MCPDEPLPPVCPDEPVPPVGPVDPPPLCLLVRLDELPVSDSLDELSLEELSLDELLWLLLDPPSYLEYGRKEPEDDELDEELDDLVEPDEELDDDELVDEDLDDELECELSVSLTLEWRVSDKFLDEPPPLQRLRPL